MTHPVSVWGPAVNGLRCFVPCLLYRQLSLCYYSKGESVWACGSFVKEGGMSGFCSKKVNKCVHSSDLWLCLLSVALIKCWNDAFCVINTICYYFCTYSMWVWKRERQREKERLRGAVFALVHCGGKGPKKHLPWSQSQSCFTCDNLKAVTRFMTMKVTVVTVL